VIPPDDKCKPDRLELPVSCRHNPQRLNGFHFTKGDAMAKCGSKCGTKKVVAKKKAPAKKKAAK